MKKHSARGELHPIQVVARRTGVTPDLLRAWEKRYGAVEPFRSAGNRRFYSDRDIERLLLLRHVTQAGRSIGQVAHLSTPALQRMVEQDRKAARRLRGVSPSAPGAEKGPGRSPSDGGPPPDGEPGYHLSECVETLRNLDVSALERVLSRGSLALGNVTLMERVLVPLIQTLGDNWRNGSMRIVHEHLASVVIRSFLGSLMEGVQPTESAPHLVITTPSGQWHELGALLASATAVSEGWRVTYLGPNLPAEEIAAAIQTKKARALALSIVYPSDDPHLVDQLTRLRSHLGPEATILVGGSAAGSYQPILKSIRAILIADLPSLRLQLQALRGTPSS